MDKGFKTTRLIYSLRTQLFVGAILLLGIAVSAVSYFLILHQKHILTAELKKMVILQGRNIALSSEKVLLHADPEFELYPLVIRIIDDNERVTSISIVDNEGVVQGHKDLVMISKSLKNPFYGYSAASSPLLREDEQLFENNDVYRFLTPIMSAETPVGAVYLEYSKSDLLSGIRSALELTLLVSAAVLILASALSLMYFGRISRPMQDMLRGVRALAEGNFGVRIPMRTRNEFRVLADSFNEMSGRIEKAQAELVSKERMDRELEIARDIQQSLIPTDVQPPKGWEFGHYYQSANEVGGDYLEVIQIDESKIGFVMADVSGKGVPGLVIMAMVKILTQEFITSGASPREIVCNLNQALQGNMKRNMFVTFFVGILDVVSNELIFSNAGHNPLLIYSGKDQSTRFFRMAGVPLGAFESAAFDPSIIDYRISLEPGDVVLQYTDGLNESHRADGGVLGIEAVNDVARETAGAGAEALVRALVAKERRFRGDSPQFDDITLMAIGALPVTVPAENCSA